MSNTYAPEGPNALDNLPWVEVDGDLAEALEQFAGTADRRIARESAPKATEVVLIPTPAYAGSALGCDAPDEASDMQDVLDFKDGAMIMTPTEQETFDELAQQRSPRLATPLPLD